jgi:hypothetical protein
MRTVVAALLFVAACNRQVLEEEPSKKLGATAAPAMSLSFTNHCSMDVWVASQPNAGYNPLPGGSVKLAANGGKTSYSVPAGGWAGRFWPKTNCNASGDACTTGQAIPPCPPTGCQPPADTKVEFFFPPTSSSDRPYYDVSLVDGFSIAMKIDPSTSDATCVPTSCSLDLTQCPVTENEGIGDLRIMSGDDIVQCFSPCKKWTWPTPLGDGQTEQDNVGSAMCCPNPPVTPEECNAGAVAQTEYVELVHAECPSAYSFAFDDKGGSHDCPNGTTFHVTLCP